MPSHGGYTRLLVQPGFHCSCALRNMSIDDCHISAKRFDLDFKFVALAIRQLARKHLRGLLDRDQERVPEGTKVFCPEDVSGYNPTIQLV